MGFDLSPLVLRPARVASASRSLNPYVVFLAVVAVVAILAVIIGLLVYFLAFGKSRKIGNTTSQMNSLNMLSDSKFGLLSFIATFIF